MRFTHRIPTFAVNPNRATCVNPPYPGGYLIGDLVIEPRLRRIRHPDGELELTQRVFDLLLVFVTEPFTLHARETLFERVWGTLHIEDTNLTQNISILRKSLGEERKHWIRTVSRTGYCFEPPGEIRIIEDPRELPAWPPQQNAGPPPGAGSATDALFPTNVPVIGPSRPDVSRPLRTSPGRILMAVLIGTAGLLLQGAQPSTRAALAAEQAAGLSIGVVITQVEPGRNHAERETTRLLREWVRWKLSRLPSVILIEEQHLISGRTMPGYYLDLSVSITPGTEGARAHHAFNFAFRPIYEAAADAPDARTRRIVLEGEARQLPAMIDQVSREVLGDILPHRRNDPWPALALEPEAAVRFASAAEAVRQQTPDALRQLETVVQAAPEFGPARLLLAGELAERRHFREANEQAQLAQIHTVPMPLDAAVLVEAETGALVSLRRARALELYRRLWIANPARMEFLYRQARIHLWNFQPEAAYELLSLDEWERETGPLRIRRLVARADAALLLGYLHQSENSAKEAISRIDGGQGGSMADLGLAQYLTARVAAQLYAQDDPGAPFTQAAATLARAGHEYQATIPRFYEAVFRDDMRMAERRLAESVSLAQLHGDSLNEVWPQRMIHSFYLWSGGRAKAIAALEAGLSAASQAGALPLRDLLEMDLLAMAIEDLDMQESTQRAERLRNNQLWTKYRYRSANYTSEVLILQGRYREALAVLDASLSDRTRAGSWDMPMSELGYMSCKRMWTLLHTGDGATAVAQSRGCEDDVLTAFTAARIALLARDGEAARRHLLDARKAINSPPERSSDVSELATLATLLTRLGDLEAARRALEDARSGDIDEIDSRTQVEVDLAQAELSAAKGDWTTAARQAAALRAQIPAEAQQYHHRLTLLEIARLQAHGAREQTRKLAAELDIAAQRNGDAITRDELQRITRGLFGNALSMRK